MCDVLEESAIVVFVLPVGVRVFFLLEGAQTTVDTHACPVADFSNIFSVSLRRVLYNNGRRVSLHFARVSPVVEWVEICKGRVLVRDFLRVFHVHFDERCLLTLLFGHSTLLTTFYFHTGKGIRLSVMKFVLDSVTRGLTAVYSCSRFWSVIVVGTL